MELMPVISLDAFKDLESATKAMDSYRYLKMLNDQNVYLTYV